MPTRSICQIQEKNLLTLRKQKLSCENKRDLKKPEADENLHCFLELIVRNLDLKNNFLTFRMVV